MARILPSRAPPPARAAQLRRVHRSRNPNLTIGRLLRRIGARLAAGPSRSLAVLNIHIEKTLDDDVGAPFKQCLGLSASIDANDAAQAAPTTGFDTGQGVLSPDRAKRSAARSAG